MTQSLFIKNKISKSEGRRKITMTCRPEQILLFFSALPEHSDYINDMTDSILKAGVDWDYLYYDAESFGVAAGLAELLSNREAVADIFLGRLGKTSKREEKESESMLDLYNELSSLLSGHEFDYIPLKGCDFRIAEGPRRKCNSMTDIDILVKLSDTEEIGLLLENNGYIYQGTMSGAHMNFFTDEKHPRFIEIHWDLINRSNPLHRKLFFPDLDAVWERSIILNGERLLSEEDLLAYLTAHAVKEYFHTPKWLADIAWIFKNRLGLVDPERLVMVIDEWGVSTALGIVAEGVDYYLQTNCFEYVLAFGAVKPGMLGQYIAKRLLCYDRLRLLRPLIFAAVAGSPLHLMSVTAGSIQRLVQKTFRE